MNILEWLGIVFLTIIIFNIIIGIWAIITAVGGDEDAEIYSRH
jgi:hypothetical protein